MIPILASLLLRAQGGTLVLPKEPSATIPAEVRDWPGFGQLPTGPREVPKAFPGGGDWSSVKGEVRPDATVWRVKVFILDRIDRLHDRGPDFVWPGHHGFAPYVLDRVRRALPLMRARVAEITGGAVSLVFDVTEESEAITAEDDFAAQVGRYVAPRINGGRYESEDAVFRGPYPSVFVIHPVGGAAAPIFEIQGAPVSVVGVPDVRSQASDGGLANDLAVRWLAHVAARAKDAGATVETVPVEQDDGTLQRAPWPTLVKGGDDSTEERLRMVKTRIAVPDGFPVGGQWNERGPETTVRLTKDPARGTVLTVDEVGPFRQGGVALPTVPGGWAVDAKRSTLSFWAKSDAKDPIVLQFDGAAGTSLLKKSVWLGRDVPFAYDGAWHEVRLALRPFTRVDTLLVAPDAEAIRRARQSLGPIEASFSAFALGDDPAQSAPSPEAPSPTSASAEARAAWAHDAPPGDARRLLLKDPVEAVRANAALAAAATPDPKDEPALTEDALYTFEPAVFRPALRALAALRTPSAQESIRQALRIAASERARGEAAEILASSGNPALVPLFVGLNQVRSRAARISAIHALALIPGKEAALMRLAYLGQDDPEVKLAATRTADPDDDAQARKLLWSAVNEPSDAVRLESLVRLSRSKVAAFREAGLKGIADDSVGVRVDLLRVWTAAPSEETLPAVRAAMKDPSPRVRTAAVEALGANPAPLGATDLPFDDPDPRVELRLLQVAKARGIAVPEAARKRWRESPDPALRAAST